MFGLIPTLFVIVYFLLNLAYSLGLKNVPIIDITILVSGFLIRLLYGAAITEIKISNWLYLTVVALSFYLALGKRRNELLHVSACDTRLVLKYYPESFLDKFMYLCLGLTISFYALWCMDKGTIARYNNDNLIFSVPFVFLIMMKYSLNVEREKDGDPVEVILHDKILLLLCLLYLCIMFMILYL